MSQNFSDSVTGHTSRWERFSYLPIPSQISDPFTTRRMTSEVGTRSGVAQMVTLDSQVGGHRLDLASEDLALEPQKAEPGLESSSRGRCEGVDKKRITLEFTGNLCRWPPAILSALVLLRVMTSRRCWTVPQKRNRFHGKNVLVRLAYLKLWHITIEASTARDRHTLEEKKKMPETPSINIT